MAGTPTPTPVASPCDDVSLDAIDKVMARLGDAKITADKAAAEPVTTPVPGVTPVVATGYAAPVLSTLHGAEAKLLALRTFLTSKQTVRLVSTTSPSQVINASAAATAQVYASDALGSLLLAQHFAAVDVANTGSAPMQSAYEQIQVPAEMLHVFELQAGRCYMKLTHP